MFLEKWYPPGIRPILPHQGVTHKSLNYLARPKRFELPTLRFVVRFDQATNGR